MSSRISLTVAELEAAVAHREKIIEQLIEAREASDVEWESRCADKDASIQQLIEQLQKAEAAVQDYDRELESALSKLAATPSRTRAHE